MNQNNLEEFASIMAGLQETFVPNKPISDMKIEMYFNFFKKHSIEDFKKACFGVLKTKKISTFPLPAEIEECISGDRGLNAWLMAREASGLHGMQYCVKFPDPVIHSVIKAMGGWVQFCSMPRDRDIAFAQKDFERLYTTMRNSNNHPEFLQGMYDVKDNYVEISDDGKFQNIDYKAKEIIENPIDDLVKGITK